MNFKKVLCTALVAAGALFCAASAHAQANVYVVGVGSSALFPSITLAEVTGDPITSSAPACGTFVWTGKDATIGGAAGTVAQGNDARQPGGPNPEPGTVSVVWNAAANAAANPIPANSGAVICVYLSVDSMVGQRLLFGVNAGGASGTLNHNSGGNNGAKKVAGINDAAQALPAQIQAAVSGLQFTTAYTDIRAEDGQLAVGRAAGAQPASYAPGPFGYDKTFAINGTSVYSSFSGAFAQVSPYNISGTDSFSGGVIPVFTTIPVGASPVMIMVNDNISLGAATNILSKTATKVFSGQLGSLQGIFGASVVANASLGVSQIQREMISGTYNTFEWQLVHARDGDSSDSQERSTITGPVGLINPTPTTTGCPGGGLTPPQAFVAGQIGCTNPMFFLSGNNSIRYRAAGGTGEMINAVMNNLGAENTFIYGSPCEYCGDNIGYAFYSFGAEWNDAKNNLRYLQLQSNDPLFKDYGTTVGWGGSGHFPTCTAATFIVTSGAAPGLTSTLACPATFPTFTHILDGSYRVWIVQRALIFPGQNVPQNTLTQSIIMQAQDQSAWALKNPVGVTTGCAAPNCVNYIADWVPAANGNTTGNGYTPFTLSMVRSHYGLTLATGGGGSRLYNPNNGDSAAYCTPDQIAAGLAAPCPENGGDMAGVAFQIISDTTYNNYYGGNNFLFAQIE